jgi:hypothetical protein
MQRVISLLIIIGLCGCGADSNSRAQQSQTAARVASVDDPSGGQGASDPVASQVFEPDDARYVTFPAAGVKLVRPDGFDDAENFHGFQQPSTNASVMVVAIPGPFSETTGGFTPAQMNSQGMNLITREDIEIDGKQGLLLSVSQRAYGTDFAKWIVAFGDESKTTIVTATYPATHDLTLSGLLKSIVLSVRLDTTPAPEPGTDVGFTVTASEKLKITPGIGKMVMYTKDGIVPAKSPEDPLFLAAPSVADVPLEDKRQFAVQRLFQTAHTKVTSLISNTPVTIDGLEGFELLAEAEHSDSGISLVLYQVLLFDEGCYILMQGLVGAALRDEYLPEFKAMAHSFSRKRSWPDFVNGQPAEGVGDLPFRLGQVPRPAPDGEPNRSWLVAIDDLDDPIRRLRVHTGPNFVRIPVATALIRSWSLWCDG